MESAERSYPADNQVERAVKRVRLAIASRSVPKYPERGARAKNEDAVGFDEMVGIAMIFDGVGGAADGDKASQTAKSFLSEYLRGVTDDDPEIVKAKMREGLIGASNRVRDVVPKGGTTATVIKFIKTQTGEIHAIIGHVGDSRAYLIRDRGLSQITKDDSELAASHLSSEQKRRIQEKLDNVEYYREFTTEEEFRFWDQRNRITQYLGVNVEPNIYDIPLQRGNLILLTTDGVHDNLTRKELQRLAARHSSSERYLVDQIVRLSGWRATGGEKDLDVRLSHQPFLRRLKEKVTWRLRGKPRHFRAKRDDITAVAIFVGDERVP